MVPKAKKVKLYIKKLTAFNKSCKGLFQIDEFKSLTETEILFFCHDINRSYTYHGKKYSTIVDTLNELFIEQGITSLTIARPYSTIPTNTCFGNVCRVNGLIARAYLFGYLQNLITKIFPGFKSKSIYQFQVDIWGVILNKTKPKVIIGIEPIKELCEAAKVRGICVIDLQHGANMDASGTNAGHYYRMGYREPEQKGWPDFTACWDTSSCKLMREHRASYLKPILLGHPWVSRFLSVNAKKDDLIQELNIKYPLEKTKPVILFSLQYTRDVDGNSNSFPPIPIQLDKFIRTEGDSYTWWIRIHPQLLRQPHRDRILKEINEMYGSYHNVNWTEVSYAPLPYVLEKTDLHFTRDSSVTKEAAMLGVKTGLFGIPGRHDEVEELFSNEIKENYAKFLDVNDYEEIRAFIIRSIKVAHREKFDYGKQSMRIIEFVNVTSNAIQKGRSINTCMNEFSDKYMLGY